ncbi:sensor histidine kinase [Actinomadura scrupuli]|uniref:sensor histidine kinase n=1 Tax=Actinomadura scrupuli TaxID=559629 RepID=UPI003D95DFF5
MCIAVGVLLLNLAGNREDERTAERVNTATDGVLLLIKQGRLPAVLPGPEEIQVLDSRGRVVAASRKLAGKPPIATFRPDPEQVRMERTVCRPDGLKGCMTVVSAKVFEPDGVWLLYTAVPLVPWYGSRTLLFLVIGASLLTTALMAARTFLTVTRSLAPVDAIRTELAEITASGLDRRVPVPGNQDEIRLLAETANATLDRLEGAYGRLRQFTADASHDLRSPITAMRTQVEEALMYPEEADWPRTATTVLTGLERLQAIVSDLLTLARLDAGAPLVREPADLGRLAGAEIDRREHRVRVVKDLRDGVYVDCDRLRVTRLLTNLLDNAARHADSKITVTVRAEGSDAVLEVLDDGAGIAPEHREMVFDRFTRLQASRERDTEGTGLGLAIARDIARAHGGSLTVEDSERGARFVLRLPRCDRPGCAA